MILTANGQRNISPMARQAIDLFEQGKFYEAVTAFEKLTTRYPADPLYQYYLAASLLESNLNPDRAIDLLKSVLIKWKTTEVYYYLAVAYYRKFNLIQANENIQKAKNSSSNTQLICKGIKSKLPSNVELDNYLTSNLKNICIQKYLLSIDSISKYICETLNDTYNDLTINVEKNNILCFSNSTSLQFKSEFRASSQSYDIVVIRTSGKATEPVVLKKPINTEYDEVFPFVNPNDGYLYFSSNRNPFNGFDIYRAKIDTIHFKVQEIEQLPFPINSPWNDYLYVSKVKTSYLVSDRETNIRNVKIYTLIDDNSDHTRWVRIQTPDRCMFTNLYFEEHKKTEREVLATNDLIEKKLIFHTIIDEALVKQRQADSIQLILRNLKNQLTYTKDDENRRRLFSEIKKYETRYKQMQQEVNNYYQQITESQNIKILNNETDENTINSTKKLNSEFSIQATSPYSANNPIPENIKFPLGLIYTIQIGAFSKKVLPDFFSGIHPIMAEFLIDRNIYKYYAGIFRSFNEADSGLQKVRSLGFKEAFIVAYFDNKKIPLSRAKEMEKVNSQ